MDKHNFKLKVFLCLLFFASCWGIEMVDNYRYIAERIFFMLNSYVLQAFGICVALFCLVVLAFLTKKESITIPFLGKVYWEVYFITMMLAINIIEKFAYSNLKYWAYRINPFKRWIWLSGNVIIASIKILIITLCILFIYIIIVKGIKSGKVIENLLIYQIIKKIKYIYSFILVIFLLFFGNMFLIFIGYAGANIFAIMGAYNFFILSILGIMVVQFGKLFAKIENLYNGEYEAKTEDDSYIFKVQHYYNMLEDISAKTEKAIEDQLSSERFKTELITNVSHDIKTPLTSVINYIDLMKKEEIADKKIIEYLEVLDRKSQRLKVLIDDLVEASKASTKNLTVEMMSIDLNELMAQVLSDFDEQFIKNGLTMITDFPETEIWVFADGRYLYRIIENLYTNACKYSVPNSRIYADIKVDRENVIFTLKNISKEALNISVDELMERFVRGDRSRTVEGSGLGLFIAKSLVELMSGRLELSINGDLFEAKVTLKV